MAAIPEITVTVERAAHDAMRDFARAMYEKHRLRIDAVNFRWINTGGVADDYFTLREVEIQSGTGA